MCLHEQSAAQFIADDHVAADRNPLPANNGVNRVQLLAKTQVPRLFIPRLFVLRLFILRLCIPSLFERFEIRINRPRDIKPLPPGRRFRIAGDPVISGSRAGAADPLASRSGRAAATDADCKPECTRREAPRAPQSRAAAFAHSGSRRLRRPLLHRAPHRCR